MKCLCCCWPGRPKEPTPGPKPPSVPLDKQPAPVQPTPVAPPNQPERKWLLGPQETPPPGQRPKKCLVLDLDETLVHSSFKPISDADFQIEIELDGVIYRVYVRKRPGVDAFLKAVGEKFEVVIFTASLAKYADPLLDILDPNRVVNARLFRDACVQHYGNYVKDLSHLGRPLSSVIIIDNSPFSYMFQPDNAIPIMSWFNNKQDRQLWDLLPFLDTLADAPDVTTVLARKDFSFLTAAPADDGDSQLQPDEEDQQDDDGSNQQNTGQGGQGNDTNVPAGGGQQLIWSVQQGSQ